MRLLSSPGNSVVGAFFRKVCRERGSVRLLKQRSVERAIRKRHTTQKSKGKSIYW